MYIIFIVLGLLIGGVIADVSEEFFGVLAGGGLGFLLARMIKLGRRLRELESSHTSLRQQVTSMPTAASSDIAEPETTTKEPSPPDDFVQWSRPPAATAADTGGETTEFTEVPFERGGPEQPSERPSNFRRQPSAFQLFLKRVGSWFTTGNVPVKVGVILSFFGVAFLLKYAIDQELFSFPIEFRLLGVAAAGIVLIVVGWRLRAKLRVYALSLQGGGCGILFLTIFAAFRIWELIPAGLAFVLLVALAAFTGALSILQKSRWLVILGAVGGFLAPVLASTGQGSHVALFSYYLVLNACILGVAWFRAWRELNVIGFVFTFVIGAFWGYRYYRPELFASTEPFLILYFLFYQAIAILYALRQPPGRIGIVDGTLVFGTPVIAFPLQAALVGDFEYGLAISAAAVAVFYAATAAWLRGRAGDYLSVLSESFIALAVAFATLAIPLALDARWTAGAWALEGAALIWIATRQPQHLANLAGTALIVFAGFSFTISGWDDNSGWPVLNGNVLAGALISISALFGARRLQGFDRAPLEKVYPVIAWGLFGWGILWLLATAGEEIDDRLVRDHELHAWLLYLTAITAGFRWFGVVRDWSMARQLTWLFLPIMAWVALAYADYHRHFLAGLGWLAWPLAFAVQASVLRMMDRRGNTLAAGWHVGTAVLLTLVLAREVFWQVMGAISGDWEYAAASTVPGITALLIWRFRGGPQWPVPHHAFSYRAVSLALVAGQLLYLAAASTALPGVPGPIRYVPVLNPFDLAMLFAVLVALMSLTVVRRDAEYFAESGLQPWLAWYRFLIAAAMFVLTTAALVRGVHFYTHVPWEFEQLARSDVVQTSLSIYWGLLGFAGMILGARRANRWIWVGGAGFMGLVVVKLFLVDLGNSGTIERVISFIGIGVLLLVVGYFAPAPPRQTEEAS